MALEKSSKLSFEQRHQAITLLASHWSQLDSLARFSMIPRVSASVPQAIAWNREFIQRSGRVQATEKSVNRKIELIRQLEQTATIAAKLPGSRIKVLALNEVAHAYEDLGIGLKQLPAPRGLRTADKLAYDQMLAQLARPFERKAVSARSKASLLIADSDASNPRWGRANLDTGTRSEILKARWSEALSSGMWPQVAYFIQESEQKRLISRDELKIAKAYSLAAAGANAEKHMALAAGGNFQ
jgi:hypothetical protein